MQNDENGSSAHQTWERIEETLRHPRRIKDREIVCLTRPLAAPRLPRFGSRKGLAVLLPPLLFGAGLLALLAMLGAPSTSEPRVPVARFETPLHIDPFLPFSADLTLARPPDGTPIPEAGVRLLVQHAGQRIPLWSGWTDEHGVAHAMARIPESLRSTNQRLLLSWIAVSEGRLLRREWTVELKPSSGYRWLADRTVYAPGQTVRMALHPLRAELPSAEAVVETPRGARYHLQPSARETSGPAIFKFMLSPEAPEGNYRATCTTGALQHELVFEVASSLRQWDAEIACLLDRRLLRPGEALKGTLVHTDSLGTPLPDATLEYALESASCPGELTWLALPTGTDPRTGADGRAHFDFGPLCSLLPEALAKFPREGLRVRLHVWAQALLHPRSHGFAEAVLTDHPLRVTFEPVQTAFVVRPPDSKLLQHGGHLLEGIDQPMRISVRLADGAPAAVSLEAYDSEGWSERALTDLRSGAATLRVCPRGPEWRLTVRVRHEQYGEREVTRIFGAEPQREGFCFWADREEAGACLRLRGTSSLRRVRLDLFRGFQKSFGWEGEFEAGAIDFAFPPVARGRAIWTVTAQSDEGKLAQGALEWIPAEQARSGEKGKLELSLTEEAVAWEAQGLPEACELGARRVIPPPGELRPHVAAGATSTPLEPSPEGALWASVAPEFSTQQAMMAESLEQRAKERQWVGRLGNRFLLAGGLLFALFLVGGLVRGRRFLGNRGQAILVGSLCVVLALLLYHRALQYETQVYGIELAATGTWTALVEKSFHPATVFPLWSLGLLLAVEFLLSNLRHGQLGSRMDRTGMAFCFLAALTCFPHQALLPYLPWYVGLGAPLVLFLTAVSLFVFRDLGRRALVRYVPVSLFCWAVLLVAMLAAVLPLVTWQRWEERRRIASMPEEVRRGAALQWKRAGAEAETGFPGLAGWEAPVRIAWERSALPCAGELSLAGEERPAAARRSRIEFASAGFTEPLAELLSVPTSVARRDVVPGEVRLGEPVTVRVTLVNRLDRTVHMAAVVKTFPQGLLEFGRNEAGCYLAPRARWDCLFRGRALKEGRTRIRLSSRIEGLEEPRDHELTIESAGGRRSGPAAGWLRGQGGCWLEWPSQRPPSREPVVRLACDWRELLETPRDEFLGGTFLDEWGRARSLLARAEGLPREEWRQRCQERIRRLRGYAPRSGGAGLWRGGRLELLCSLLAEDLWDRAAKLGMEVGYRRRVLEQLLLASQSPDQSPLSEDECLLLARIPEAERSVFAMGLLLWFMWEELEPEERSAHLRYLETRVNPRASTPTLALSAAVLSRESVRASALPQWLGSLATRVVEGDDLAFWRWESKQAWEAALSADAVAGLDALATAWAGFAFARARKDGALHRRVVSLLLQQLLQPELRQSPGVWWCLRDVLEQFAPPSSWRSARDSLCLYLDGREVRSIRQLAASPAIVEVGLSPYLSPGRHRVELVLRGGGAVYWALDGGQGEDRAAREELLRAVASLQKDSRFGGSSFTQSWIVSLTGCVPGSLMRLDWELGGALLAAPAWLEKLHSEGGVEAYRLEEHRVTTWQRVAQEGSVELALLLGDLEFGAGVPTVKVSDALVPGYSVRLRSGTSASSGPGRRHRVEQGDRKGGR